MEHLTEGTVKKMKENYPEVTKLTERTQKALDLYKKIAHKAQEKNWKIAFLSGLAVDANFGYITRQHRDADIIASKEDAQHIKDFLESEGHVVYSPNEVMGECLKVDQANPDRPMHCHCDIHYFWEDASNNITIPLLGKVMKLTANFEDATTVLHFWGETARFLKPKYILEEKIGWRDQIGLKMRDEYILEMKKINHLINI
jgi:hypothetical protein